MPALAASTNKGNAEQVIAVQRLMQAPNAALARIWADVLCEAGYPATVERLNLTSLAGEIPPDQCLPEIWLRHPEHLPAARQLLEQLRQLPQRQWQCPACGEQVEGGFDQCWACGHLQFQDGGPA